MPKYVGTRPPTQSDQRPETPAVKNMTRFDFIVGGTFERVLLDPHEDDAEYTIRCVIRYNLPTGCDGKNCVKKHSKRLWYNQATCSLTLGINSYASANNRLYFLSSRRQTPDNWILSFSRIARDVSGYAHLYIPNYKRGDPILGIEYQPQFKSLPISPS